MVSVESKLHTVIIAFAVGVLSDPEEMQSLEEKWNEGLTFSRFRPFVVDCSRHPRITMAGALAPRQEDGSELGGKWIRNLPSSHGSETQKP